jgi:ATP-dependent Clp protease ATP-binding subunit ClpC
VPLFLIILCATFLISPSVWMRCAGVLLVLFFVDWLVHRGQADRSFDRIPRQGSVNVASYLTPKAFRVIERAYDAARLTKSRAYVVLMQELLGLPLVQNALRRMDHDPKEILDRLAAVRKDTQLAEALPRDILTKSMAMAVVTAMREGVAHGHRFIEPSDLFVALPTLGDEHVDRLWSAFSLDPRDARQALVLTEAIGHLQGRRFASRPRVIKHRIMNRAWTSRPTPILDRVASDLTDLAREDLVGFLVGHDEEYNRLVETIARPINPHALLVGTPGSGKETVVGHLAAAIVHNDVPQALADKRLVKLDVAALLAEVTHDTAAATIHKVIEEITIAGNVILYIPDFHNLMKTSQGAYLAAADALMPLIMNEQFSVIGTTYPREFVQLVEPRSDVLGVFDVIRMIDITDEHAESILIAESPSLEARNGVTISFGAIREAVRLGRRYFQSVKPLPASAQELLKEAVVHVVEQAKDRGRNAVRVVRAEDVVRVAETKTHVPLHATQETETSNLLNLETTIHEQLVGQDEAVHAVAEALREYRSGLTRPGGPIASFLFVGPTGVGKTELAKILARIQFASENAMVRFDMTEYQDEAGIHRFIGTTDGSVPGALTEAVLASPYRLILLDEFEKAHRSIMQLFLQVLEDGRLTDGLGRTVDFSNTIIIATSNAHADILMQALQHGEDVASIEEYLKQRLSDVFAPELLNRFSKIIVFRNLSPDELYKVAELQVAQLATQLAAQHITLTANQTALQELVKHGYDPAFGARPLRRAVEEGVRSLLAREILSKRVGAGSMVELTYENGAFALKNANVA